MPKGPVRFKDLLKALKPYGVIVKKEEKDRKPSCNAPFLKARTKDTAYPEKTWYKSGNGPACH